MSSSRVFKADAAFTPTPIVRRVLDPDEALLIEPARAETPPAPAPPVAAEPAPPVDLEALRAEAYNQGMADLAAQWETEFQQAMAAFADACQKIDRQRRALVEHSRGDIINLIISLTRTIVGEELATPRNVIAATVQRALEQAIDSEEYYVTLHPDDLALAEARAPELVAAVRGLERLVFKTDPSLTRGGCLLESALCSVDATVETQLDSLREFLGEQPGLLPDPDQGADQA
ncbi:MAG: hypothetical protein KA768_12855 [Desulfobulbus sp.]|uniref:FliH/SctL family protein n=1 Tax=uncultured Desulfobulbus sp. TaxID=239745 RepID=UPI001B481DF6|nr:FliH/SctL family protein [uncultured Desulfobulbus sp.]MBP7518714.1 hypothetical protein [Desulfobulbus sp.]